MTEGEVREKWEQKLRKLYEEIQTLRTETEQEKEKRKEKIRNYNKELKAFRAASLIKVATEHGYLCEECGIGWIRNRSCSKPDCTSHDPEKERRRPSPFDNLRRCEQCQSWIHLDDFDTHKPCRG